MPRAVLRQPRASCVGPVAAGLTAVAACHVHSSMIQGYVAIAHPSPSSRVKLPDQHLRSLIQSQQHKGKQRESVKDRCADPTRRSDGTCLISSFLFLRPTAYILLIE